MVEIGRPVKDIEIDSNTSIEKIFEEPGKSDDFSEDPYGETSPENIMSHL